MANSSSRGGARVIWACVHTAEGIRKASDLKAFFERSTDSSAHAVADDNTLLDNLVPYDRASWTLRNGNTRSLNLELCGFAKWTRAEWLQHQGMLDNAAAWIRRACQWAGIPIVKLSAADIKAGRAGVIGHVDYTNGTGDGTHWDPGPGFPWDIVIARAAGSAGGVTTSTKTVIPMEECMKDVPAGQDVETRLFAAGRPHFLWIEATAGSKVTVRDIAYVKRTSTDPNKKTGDYGPLGQPGYPDLRGSVFDADRPGPIQFADDVAWVTLYTDADDEFSVAIG